MLASQGRLGRYDSRRPKTVRSLPQMKWRNADHVRCVDINTFYLGNAITGVTTDAIVYLLSIPIIKPLQMDRKMKLQLLATMLVGGL
jgi:hypothetical protein